MSEVMTIRQQLLYQRVPLVSFRRCATKFQGGADLFLSRRVRLFDPERVDVLRIQSRNSKINELFGIDRNVSNETVKKTI